MTRSRIEPPGKDSQTRAHDENKRGAEGSRSAGPSRAKQPRSGGGHEKKPSKAPKQGG